jgi:hypothetical protein
MEGFLPLLFTHVKQISKHMLCVKQVLNIVANTVILAPFPKGSPFSKGYRYGLKYFRKTE